MADKERKLSPPDFGHAAESCNVRPKYLVSPIQVGHRV